MEVSCRVILNNEHNVNVVRVFVYVMGVLQDNWKKDIKKTPPGKLQPKKNYPNEV